MIHSETPYIKFENYNIFLLDVLICSSLFSSHDHLKKRSYTVTEWNII